MDITPSCCAILLQQLWMDCIHPPPTLFWLGDLGLFSPIKPPNSQIIRSSMQCPSSKENGTKNPSFYLEKLLQESHEGHIKSVSFSKCINCKRQVNDGTADLIFWSDDLDVIESRFLWRMFPLKIEAWRYHLQRKIKYAFVPSSTSSDCLPPNSQPTTKKKVHYYHLWLIGKTAQLKGKQEVL